MVSRRSGPRIGDRVYGNSEKIHPGLFRARFGPKVICTLLQNQPLTAVDSGDMSLCHCNLRLFQRFLDQYHVVLFLVVECLGLQFDRSADELLEFGQILRFLVEQVVDDFL